jgi:tRNA threonylcarbamoyladenosine biosynthesis protein TsaB
MIVLAIEASTHHLGVALMLPDGTLREHSATVPDGGSEHLLPWIHTLLSDAGIALAQVDAIAFGAGPGSFTGVRLACGIAQGLGSGLDCPVIGISSLEALAQASGEQRVLACMDARKDEVYVAAYARDDASGEWQECLAAQVLAAEDVRLPPGEGWVGCGDGFAVYAARLPALDRIESALKPTAVAVATLALPRLLRGEGGSAATATPLYVRNKVALTTAERLARGGVN